MQHDPLEPQVFPPKEAVPPEPSQHAQKQGVARPSDQARASSNQEAAPPAILLASQGVSVQRLRLRFRETQRSSLAERPPTEPLAEVAPKHADFRAHLMTELKIEHPLAESAPQ